MPLWLTLWPDVTLCNTTLAIRCRGNVAQSPLGAPPAAGGSTIRMYAIHMASDALVTHYPIG